MSAPVRTLSALALPTRLNKRHVEPDARRRAVSNARMLPGVNPRGRGSVIRGAVAANWAEWTD
jgi:hypothetical protein